MEDSETRQRDEDVMRRYCKKTIRMMKLKNGDSERREINSSQKPQCETDDPPVPQQLINLLKMKSFREKLKTTAEMEFHDPQRCRSCQVKRAELAQNEFIRRRTTQLLSPLLEAKIQSHLLNKNSICLIGEVLKDMPRPTDDPGLVWKALKAREMELTQQKGSR